MARMNNETKTGIFVTIAVILLVAVVLKVGNFKFFRSGYNVLTRFHFTGGVQKHAPVRLSGVDVGEVKNIRIIYGNDTLIELEMWIEDGVKIRKDSKAYVTTLGLMGEKYIEILAGSDKSEYAKAGDLIPSEDPIRFEELIKLGTEVATDIGEMAKDIRKMVNHIDDTIVNNRSKLDRMVDNFEETSENFRDFSQDIKFHPWKVLMKGKEAPKEKMEAERNARLAKKGKIVEVPLEAPAAVTTVPSKNNFSSANKSSR